MAQEYASGGQLPDDVEVEGALAGDGGSAHGDSSSRLEQFGLGVAASIMLGGVVGVAAASALEGSAVALIVAIGLGFLFSPLVGLLTLRRAE
ncbi:hypothetical protein [Halobellus rubicundus]|uniref:Glycine zipper-like domain-containing protein n=1 Tax=Halobellus rubicundus TaxID=2996466 RepID=A0ABD5MCA9_9EURY